MLYRDLQKTNDTHTRDICIVIAVIIFAIIVLYPIFTNTGNGDATAAGEAKTEWKAGDVGRTISSANLIPVGVSREALDALMKADTANDEVGRQQLRNSGQIMPIQPGIRVLVLTTQPYELEVRIMDGPYQGSSGWTPQEFIER